MNGLEIGAASGMLTLRAGSQKPGVLPARVVVPANLGEELLRGMEVSVRDAEEDYWKIIGPLVGSAPAPSDEDALAEHIHEWLLDQDWPQALRMVPYDQPPFLITHAGHVGLVIDPPYTPRPVLLIFDPLQLQRTRTKFVNAITHAYQTPPSAPWSMIESVTEVLRSLNCQPWPLKAPPLSPGHAETEMRQRRAEFLAREPFIRPEDNDLTPDAGAQGDPAESVTGCERCAFSVAIGGILCLCGHDWACHDGSPSLGEPCTHCQCQDMRAPSDP
ncbi:hypothetical protein [Actinokineospora inagensis]|uniref:hypothetical protein n=1 Tax=Actinokineospora inagensis TaxID=103730 RepID=UPI00047A90AE|nr:hypothetical protein [Actinokineospora inagensis]